MAKRPPRPGFRFPGPPPKEALEFFRAKGWKPGFDHRDIWLREHAAAFTVAKAMLMDILADIRGALDSALAEGKTFRQFQHELTPILQQKGWWGRKEVMDPQTGKRRLAQLGSPRRLRVIYNANLRSARAAGQWERAQRRKRALPFLLYQLGPSERHRPEHVAWAGTLLPVDDPWWNAHYPPNGWGCRCWVRQVSRREAERLGGQTRRPRADPVPWTNKRTGEIQQVDRGLDAAWATNPGKHREGTLRDALTGRITGWSAEPAIQRAAVRTVVDSPVLDGFLHQVRRFRKAHPAAAEVPRLVEDQIGEIPVATLDAVALKALRLPRRAGDAQSAVVRISPDTALKQLKHEDLTVSRYRSLPDLLDRAEILVQEEGRKLAFFRELDGKPHRAVVKATEKGELYLVSFHRVQPRNRRGKLVREGR